MSVLYPDLNTNFPENLDTFPTYLNVTATDGPLIQQYMEAMNAGNQVLANQILAQIPAAEQKVIKATDLNKVMQATLAVERFYKDDIYDYIAQEQQNWENIINQFTYKGIYSSGNTYQKYNMVGYTTNGFTLVYIAIQDVPTGNAPLNETFWRVMTIQGQEGEPGVGLSYRLEWNPATQYESNQAVTYDGVLWMALQTNINVQPGTDDNIWEKILDFTVATYPIQPTQPTNLPVGGLWFNTEGNPTQYYYLTPLQSPASAGEIGAGYQAYDSEGNVIMGTATLNGPTYTAGGGIEIAGDVISAKISTDANNKVEFGTDGGLLVDTGVDGAVQGNFVGFSTDGQLIDSGSKASDFAPAPLTQSLALYVNAATGSDSNDGLSAAHPKKTIQSAINTIPKLLTGGRVLINIAPGEYREDLMIRGFIGVGTLQESIYLSATGTADETKLTGIIQIHSTAPVWLRNLTLRSSGEDMPLLSAYFACISMTGCVLDAAGIGGTAPAIRSVVSQFHITSTSISNANNSAIEMSGTLFATGLNGSGNKIGLQNYDPIGRVGLIATSKLDAEFAETLFIKAKGGAIIEDGVLV